MRTEERFFLNLGEQTIRFCLEHKIKVQKHLNDLFITQLRWKNIGGFADLIAVVTEKNLSIYSPPPLNHFLLANQICLYRYGPHVDSRQCRRFFNVELNEILGNPEVPTPCNWPGSAKVYPFIVDPR